MFPVPSCTRPCSLPPPQPTYPFYEYESHLGGPGFGRVLIAASFPQAMPAYKSASVEEIRLMDFKARAGGPTAGAAAASPFGQPAFGQPAAAASPAGGFSFGPAHALSLNKGDRVKCRSLFFGSGKCLKTVDETGVVVDTKTKRITTSKKKNTRSFTKFVTVRGPRGDESEYKLSEVIKVEDDKPQVKSQQVATAATSANKFQPFVETSQQHGTLQYESITVSI